MRLLFTLSVAFAAVTATKIEIRATPVFAGIPMQTPVERPRTGASTSHGCYKSVGELKMPDDQTPSSVTRGYCEKEFCKPMNATVMATKGEECYCGFSYPPKADLVDDSNCDYPCPGYPQEACGGIGSGSFWTLYNTGLAVDVPDYDPASSSSSTSAAVPTATVIEPAPTTGAADEEKGGPNVAGIAAGVVVGVVALAGIIGGGFWYMRRKRNQELEEEHRRNAAVNAFVGGGKTPSTSGSLSMTDSRMDPGMSIRRMSDGSIADNQDYSRKILRVTNA